VLDLGEATSPRLLRTRSFRDRPARVQKHPLGLFERAEKTKLALGDDVDEVVSGERMVRRRIDVIGRRLVLEIPQPSAVQDV